MVASVNMGFHPEPGATAHLEHGRRGSRWLKIKQPGHNGAEITFYQGDDREALLRFVRQLAEEAQAWHAELLEDEKDDDPARWVAPHAVEAP